MLRNLLGKRIVIYARTSQSDQTTENQVIALRDYCSRMQYEIVDEYIDSGYSGKTDKRPEFERLLNDMRSREFDCIAVWRIDRVGRSLQHLLNFLQELRNRQIDFISITELIDTATPHGELIWNILGAFSQYERSIIVSRTKAGLERARRQGIKLGRPFGSKDKKRRKRSGYYSRWANSTKKSSPS
ncbi:MAG: recombinase family protein [Candidatus Aceula lacicola]|nr:recombinase family protein [Candidatus Aceula lacicola]